MVTIPAELPLFSSVDDDTASILELVAGDRIHERDRERVVEAILTAAREHDGNVDPNVVRSQITGNPYPRVIGAVYAALRRAKVLEPIGWTTSTDTAGHNAGKPVRVYRLTHPGTLG